MDCPDVPPVQDAFTARSSHSPTVRMFAMLPIRPLGPSLPGPSFFPTADDGWDGPLEDFSILDDDMTEDEDEAGVDADEDDLEGGRPGVLRASGGRVRNASSEPDARGF